MPRYKVIQPCFLDGALRDIGDVVEFNGPPGKALLLLDDDISGPGGKPAAPKPAAAARKTEG
ncbi:hypothetical protein [Insolitispirillum peregrinum]|uniref:Uncharacterized protein n=1 Tax=Insolitispirillum peregrinum TaxID=80876 RepID=A0A1N7LGC8_9PROT|nr:hypothetical protein [Insolitispirillum peregrinum]SIS72853.1 hypothetical protein SAMN05421779_103311 [Insolitispirillum peregrinum]